MTATRPPMLLAPIYAGRQVLWPADTPVAVMRVPVYTATCTVWPIAFTATGTWYLSEALCARWAQTWQATGATMAVAVQQVIAQVRAAGWSPYCLPVHSTLHTQEDTRVWMERCMQLQGIGPDRRTDASQIEQGVKRTCQVSARSSKPTWRSSWRRNGPARRLMWTSPTAR